MYGNVSLPQKDQFKYLSMLDKQEFKALGQVRKADLHLLASISANRDVSCWSAHVSAALSGCAMRDLGGFDVQTAESGGKRMASVPKR
eukprot:861709-Pelagomonas_calceolata.AAC.3